MLGVGDLVADLLPVVAGVGVLVVAELLVLVESFV